MQVLVKVEEEEEEEESYDEQDFNMLFYVVAPLDLKYCVVQEIDKI